MANSTPWHLQEILIIFSVHQIILALSLIHFSSHAHDFYDSLSCFLIIYYMRSFQSAFIFAFLKTSIYFATIQTLPRKVKNQIAFTALRYFFINFCRISHAVFNFFKDRWASTSPTASIHWDYPFSGTNFIAD